MPHYDMTDDQLNALPAEERISYWKTRARSFEDSVKERPDYDEIAEQARKWDALPKDEQGRPLPRDIAEAYAEGAAAAHAAVHAQLVRTEFRVAAPGLPEATLDSYLEDVDMSKFLKEDGTVDTERVASRAHTLTGGRPSFQDRR